MANRGTERESVIGKNHLKQIKMLIDKSVTLLDQAKDVLPYQLWSDKLSDILDEIQEELNMED